MLSGVLVNAAIEYRKAYDSIAESCYDGGEMTDEAATELVQLEANIQKHAVGYVSIIKQLEADAMACEQEARILSERANRLKQSAKWLEERIKQAMELVGTKKLQQERTMSEALKVGDRVLATWIDECGDKQTVSGTVANLSASGTMAQIDYLEKSWVLLPLSNLQRIPPSQAEPVASASQIKMRLLRGCSVEEALSQEN